MTTPLKPGRVVVLSPIDPQTTSTWFTGHDVVSVGRDEDAVAACRGAHAVISDWTGHHRVTAEMVAALAPTCRLVQTIGAGFDAVDVAACAEAGIPVATGRGLNAEAVAEWCVWGAIAALRGLTAEDRSLAEGTWRQQQRPRHGLRGRRVGLVGLGAIGAACAPLFAAFGAELTYWSRRRRSPDEERRLGLRWLDLDELVATSDVVVVVIALADETHHLISRARIEEMKHDAVLVNAARGPVVDEDALIDALRGGAILGAALDVFDTEPLPADHRYRGLRNVTLTPHVAGGTDDAISAVVGLAIDNVQRALVDEEPRNVLEASTP
ncbi:MAG TPA: NAD(P)-dependent oxidoreductase [Nitriliruptorales bacterium]